MPYMLEARKREFVLFARLFQEELGRLPCALVRYMRGHFKTGRMLNCASSPSTRPCTNLAVKISR